MIRVHLLAMTALGLGVGLAAPGADAAGKRAPFKETTGLKMEQSTIEAKSKKLKAKSGGKRSGGTEVPRYNLQNAWPAK